MWIKCLEIQGPAVPTEKRFSSLGKALSTSSALNFQPMSSKEVTVLVVLVTMVLVWSDILNAAGVEGLVKEVTVEDEISVNCGTELKVVGVLAVLGQASVVKVLLFKGSNSLWLERLKTELQLMPRSSSPKPESISVPGWAGLE